MRCVITPSGWRHSTRRKTTRRRSLRSSTSCVKARVRWPTRRKARPRVILRGTQQSFELYSKSVDTAAAWASRYGFRACARRVAMEETEEGEIEGPPLTPSELAAFCDEVARFSDALTNLPLDAEPTELEEQLLDLSLRAAALADLPPPGTGSALAELRSTLEAVSKEAAEHGYDLRAAAAAGTDVLAPLESARAAFEIRVFGIGACSGT